MPPSNPSVSLSKLPRADGSATYTKDGYSVICGVNGPIEVQRRDPLPDEAILEVTVRPSTGGGSVRDKHHESILQSALKSLVLTSAYPRTLIQINLQIISAPENELDINGPPQSASQIDLLPALINAATYALLSASIQLKAVMVATLLVIDQEGQVVESPDARALNEARSTHVFAFESKGGCVVMESEGSFELAQWEEGQQRAREICLGAETREADGADVEMVDAGTDHGGLLGEVRRTMQEKVERETRWKTEGT